MLVGVWYDGLIYSIRKKVSLLKMKNITVYRMCKDLGIPTSSATAWKQGVYKPSITNLKKIADYFGVAIDDFL